jgi:cell division protein FtsI (penicillin-binding protein 3)
MNYHAATGLKIRIYVVLSLLGIGAGGIVARAVQVQMLQGPRLKELATRQHRHTIEVRAKRGDILDSRGEALAVSREEAQIYARPEQVRDRTAAARKLAAVLKLDEPQLRAKLGGPEPFVWLSRSASRKQAEAIETLEIPGIGMLPASRRFYPGGILAANVLGFTGLDGAGLEGLEFLYENQLAGKPVQLWLERDARGEPFLLSDQAWGTEDSPASNRLFDTDSKGTTLKLTILRPLQYLAERELEKGIQAAGGRAGCVAAIEPDTGRILALASYPSFDPNQFRRYSQANFRNRCLVGAFEPGSTFKVFVAAAALEEGLIRSEERFFCENGSYALSGGTIRDSKPHGWLSVEEIIAFSSNIGAVKIGQRLGPERMYRAIRAFGFGSRTGADFPGESAGTLLPPGRWSKVGAANISFGQGIAVTPLQLVAAVAAIANGGVLMRPYLVESAIRADGTTRRINQPQRVRQVIRPETAARIVRFMQTAVSERGTGARAQVSGYSVAGKTGTAQKPKERERGYAEGKYFSSFLGFLPAERPRLAMIVVIDEPNPEFAYGGWVAAPIFQAIAKQAMVLLKVPSADGSPAIAETDPEAMPELTAETEDQARIRQWKSARAFSPAAGSGPVAAGMTPDLRGLTLRQSLREISRIPLPVEVAGSGVVTGQSPPPGTVIKGGETIRLRLEENL